MERNEKFIKCFDDQKNMLVALEQAKLAYNEDEVPIGCCIVDMNNNIICETRNKKEEMNNSLMHAEMQALNIAMEKLGTKYLYEYCMYVTLEPCAMCAGALVNARIGRLVYGLEEPKTGCCGSKFNLVDGSFNHTILVEKGTYKDEIKELMSSFFQAKRNKN